MKNGLATIALLALIFALMFPFMAQMESQTVKEEHHFLSPVSVSIHSIPISSRLAFVFSIVLVIGAFIRPSICFGRFLFRALIIFEILFLAIAWGVADFRGDLEIRSGLILFTVGVLLASIAADGDFSDNSDHTQTNQ